MILRTRSGVNQEVRSAEWGNESQIPAPGSGWLSSAGLPVSVTQAYGLPAVSNVIRGPAEMIASLPFLVYERGPVRARAENTWQWKLLHENPSESTGNDSFQFFYDLSLSLEATQNGFIQKAKRNGRVYEMWVLDPQTVTVERDRETGEKKYTVWTPDGVKHPPAGDMLHVRGFTPKPGGVLGVSLIQTHRDAIGAGLAMQRFEGDYFRNYGVPPFWFTGASSREHAQKLVDAHKEAHAGSGNQWKAGALWGGADVKTIPISLDDAMFADAKRLSIEDICRIWRWPRDLVELGSYQGQAPSSGTSETTLEKLLKFSLLPRLRRIERAFAADPDLFPTSGVGSGRGQGVARLYGEFLTEALERADVVSRYRAYKDARQGSWITSNEIRGRENLPPIEGGDTIQQTPVGGAPNPSAPSASQNGSGGESDVASILEGTDG